MRDAASVFREGRRMVRLAGAGLSLVVGLVLPALWASTLAASGVSDSTSRDAKGLAILAKSLLALSGTGTIADLHITGSVQYTVGSLADTGTAELKVKADLRSKTTLRLSSGTIEWKQNARKCTSTLNGGAPVVTAYHNCLNTAAWFSPALLIEAVLADSNRNVAYVGTEAVDGAQVEHLRLSGVFPDTNPFATQLSVHDLYVDAGSFVPTAMAYQAHAESDALVNIPVKITFSNYQNVNGFQVPFEIKRFVQNSLLADISVQSATINPGLSDDEFGN